MTNSTPLAPAELDYQPEQWAGGSIRVVSRLLPGGDGGNRNKWQCDYHSGVMVESGAKHMHPDYYEAFTMFEIIFQIIFQQIVTSKPAAANYIINKTGGGL